MRFALLLLLLTSTGHADDWRDVPALVRSAIAPIDAELRRCSKLPKRIALIATRTKTGDTAVAMPMPPVGHRGFTKEERCLMAAIAKVELPALPDEIDRMTLGYTVTDATAAPPDQAVDAWRDPAKTLATLLDAPRRAALGACDRKPRTARLVLDLSRGKTRIWLPAWQFHAPNGDGTTPEAERRVKACMTKAIRDWRAPVLPRDLGEIQLALAVKP
jgi:hypothetical protein